MKNPRYGRCMRGCTAGFGDFVDWTCEAHMRVGEDDADMASQRWALGGGAGTGAGTVVLLLLAGVAVGGAISLAVYKLQPPENNPRTKLRDGPDTPGTEMVGTEMATVRESEEPENDDDER